MKDKYIWYGKEPFDIDRFRNDLEVNDPEILKNRTYKFKPSGIHCLWASPSIKNDKIYPYSCGWNYWCKKEDVRQDRFKHSMEFHLKDNAKILKLDNLLTIKKFIIEYTDIEKTIEKFNINLDMNKLDLEYEEDGAKYNKFFEDLFFDQYLDKNDLFSLHIRWDKIYEEYDGMEVSYHEFINIFSYLLNTWDCDSIVIWKDVIEIDDLNSFK